MVASPFHERARSRRASRSSRIRRASMATEGKAPSLAEEYSLPPQEVPVKSSAEEKSAISTTAEAAPEENAEIPPADETTAALEETSETLEVQESPEQPEADDSPAAEESSEAAEEAADEKPEIKIETAPADFRFPTTNQTRHCFTRCIEYHRCVAAKREGAPECQSVKSLLSTTDRSAQVNGSSIGTSNVKMAHSLDPCSRVHKTEKPEEIITEKTKPINRRN